MNLTPITYQARSAESSFTHHASRITRPASRVTHRSFTLVEILVTIALLSFIVLGLFSVFNQVQRAFRGSMNQVDQLEAGRAVTELLPRELEQIIPSDAPFPNGVNFYAQIPNSAPLTQALPPGTGLRRTNILEDCYMLIRSNQTWIGIGYCVRTSDTNQVLWWPQCKTGQMGVGSLYRYSASMPVLQPAGAPQPGLPQDPSTLFTGFIAAAQPGLTNRLFSRICDGVVHFRFRAFDPNGELILGPLRANTDIRFSTVAPGEIGLYQFCSNAVPASIEMELGILDQHAVDRYFGFGNGDAALAYLQRPENASHVNLFRQRIPIRNVDPLAYQ